MLRVSVEEFVQYFDKHNPSNPIDWRDQEEIFLQKIFDSSCPRDTAKPGNVGWR